MGALPAYTPKRKGDGKVDILSFYPGKMVVLRFCQCFKFNIFANLTKFRPSKFVAMFFGLRTECALKQDLCLVNGFV